MRRHGQYSLNLDDKPFSKPYFLKLKFHTVPDFVEVKNKEWVLFGKKNNYPNFLDNLYNKCAKHAAIIDRKVDFTCGAGWGYEENVPENEKLNAYLENINADGETLKDVTLKCDKDLEIFGGFYTEVVWNKGGRGFSSIKHVPFPYVRSNKDGSKFAYTKTWLDARGVLNQFPDKSEDFAVFDAFDENKRKGSQIFAFKSYRPMMDVYALPGYLAAIESIEIDVLISSHNYNDVKNGFTGKTVVNFNNGVPTPEEMDDTVKDLKDQFTGPEGQKIIFNFSDGKENAAEVLYLTQPDFYKALNDLRKTTDQEIFTGHSVTSPMLFGVKSEGQLGGRTEMVDAFELFKNIYIQPKQGVLQDYFNYLISLSGYTEKLKLNIAPPITEQLSETVLQQILTKDELRAKAGYPPEIVPLKPAARSTVDAINSLSPLVANKVLDALTPNEVRSLAGLPASTSGNAVPIPEGGNAGVVTAERIKFLAQKVCMEMLSEYGTPKDQFNIVKARAISFSTNTEAIESELNVYRQNFDQFSALERAIIDLYSKDELMPQADMAKTLNVSKEKLTSTINSLVKSGYLDKGKAQSGDIKVPEFIVTDQGKQVIEDKPAKTAEIFVMYDYVERYNAKPVITESRDFCKELMASNKLYSREDIEGMSNDFGFSVWETRGGWYTDPDTNVHRPNCRHIWNQVLVNKK